VQWLGVDDGCGRAGQVDGALGPQSPRRGIAVLRLGYRGAAVLRGEDEPEGKEGEVRRAASPGVRGVKKEAEARLGGCHRDGCGMPGTQLCARARGRRQGSPWWAGPAEKMGLAPGRKVRSFSCFSFIVFC
jgi:hypothetical protein